MKQHLKQSLYIVLVFLTATYPVHIVSSRPSDSSSEGISLRDFLNETWQGIKEAAPPGGEVLVLEFFSQILEHPTVKEKLFPRTTIECYPRLMSSNVQEARQYVTANITTPKGTIVSKILLFAGAEGLIAKTTYELIAAQLLAAKKKELDKFYSDQPLDQQTACVNAELASWFASAEFAQLREEHFKIWAIHHSRGTLLAACGNQIAKKHPIYRYPASSDPQHTPPNPSDTKDMGIRVRTETPLGATIDLQAGINRQTRQGVLATQVSFNDLPYLSDYIMPTKGSIKARHSNGKTTVEAKVTAVAYISELLKVLITGKVKTENMKIARATVGIHCTTSQ